LKECGILEVLEQEGKGRSRKCKRTLRLATKIGFSYEYLVACMISLLFLACMAYTCGYLVMICHWHGGFSWIESGFVWPFYFLVSHSVVGFIFVF